jgi:hypothetical protein
MQTTAANTFKIFASTPLSKVYNYLKIQQALYNPGQELNVPGDRDYQISKQSAHEGGKVVSPTQRPPLPPRKYPWYSFLLEAESTPGPQCDRKDYVSEQDKPRTFNVTMRNVRAPIVAVEKQ